MSSASSSSQNQIIEPGSNEEQPKPEDGGLTLPDDIPGEILTEIGKRVVSRLDVSRFRSVCRTWRRRLPPPFRFPMRVPAPPDPCSEALSYHIAESTFYSVGSEMIVVFEEDRRGGGFSASALVHCEQFPITTKFELPPVSQIPNLSFLTNAYHLHKAVSVEYDPPRKKEGVLVVADNDALKIAIIQSDAAATFNPNYPRLRDLKVVAHLIDTRKLAVLSLDGGAMNNTWETINNTSTFEDIVYYRGQLHAVERSGRALVMDYTSFHMTQVAAAFPLDSELMLELQGVQAEGIGRVMHLSVVSGDLYMFINQPKLSVRRLYKLSYHLGQWLEQHFPPDQVFVQDMQCIFPVPKTLFTKAGGGGGGYEVPLFCKFPELQYIRCAVGFKNEYDALPQSPYECHRYLRFRFCDYPGLNYYF